MDAQNKNTAKTEKTDFVQKIKDVWMPELQEDNIPFPFTDEELKEIEAYAKRVYKDHYDPEVHPFLTAQTAFWAKKNNEPYDLSPNGYGFYVEEEPLYDTDIQLLDEPVYAAIPGRTATNVLLVLKKNKIEYKKPNELSSDMMLHEFPRSALLHGQRVSGVTIYSRVPQVELERISDEVDGLFPQQIAGEELEMYLEQPVQSPETNIIRIEVDDDTGVTTEYYEDGHIVKC